MHSMNVPRMNLRSLHLLLVFDAIPREGSVAGVARRLRLSLPATSHALNRLRGRLKDSCSFGRARGWPRRSERRVSPVRCETRSTNFASPSNLKSLGSSGAHTTSRSAIDRTPHRSRGASCCGIGGLTINRATVGCEALSPRPARALRMTESQIARDVPRKEAGRRPRRPPITPRMVEVSEGGEALPRRR